MLGSVIVLAALFGGDVFASSLSINPQCDSGKTFDKCMVNVFVKNIPTIAANGIPSANIPPIDPFKVPKLKLKFNNNLLVGSFVAKSIVLTGLSGVQFLKFETNIGKPSSKNNHVTLHLEQAYPSLSISGKYEKSNVVALKRKMSEKGSYKIVLNNIKVKISAKGKLLKHSDTAYYPELDQLNLDKLTIGDLKVSASQIVKDDPQLSKQVIGMVNSSWRTLYKEMYGTIKGVIEKEAVKYINRYLKISGLSVPEALVIKYRSGK